MSYLGSTGLPLFDGGKAWPVPNGLSWIASGYSSFLETPGYHYTHSEWPGPAPSAWGNSIWSSPTNPGNAPTLTRQCADDIANEDTCNRNASCQLGVLHAANAPSVDLASVPNLDWEQFQLGRVLHSRCVQHQVQSFAGAWN
jgi:hypothetical protein